MQINSNNLDSALIEYVPEFKHRVEEHIKDQFGEILQHVLLADFARFLLEKDACNPTNATDASVVARGVAVIEALLESGDRDLENAVAVSFLEHTFQSTEGRAGCIAEQFLPRTRDMLSKLTPK